MKYKISVKKTRYEIVPNFPPHPLQIGQPYFRFSLYLNLQVSNYFLAKQVRDTTYILWVCAHICFTHAHWITCVNWVSAETYFTQAHRSTSCSTFAQRLHSMGQRQNITYACALVCKCNIQMPSCLGSCHQPSR